MNDDPDEPGGLWDPDAITLPPAPARPALYAVPGPDAKTHDPSHHVDEPLVRLDQIRPTHPDETDLNNRPPQAQRRHRLQVAATLLAATSLAAAVLAVIAAHDQHATPSTTRHTSQTTQTVAHAPSGTPHLTPAADESNARRTARRRTQPRRSSTTQHSHHNATPHHTNPPQPTTTHTTTRQVSNVQPSPTTAQSNPAQTAATAQAATNAGTEFGFER